ncbi:TIM-barrel domain-containing protein [Nodularia spumigena]|uniref:TIM-barrel domain-containing protein n=1 Tax=Nodularia spumigena TaxID=70799 RepID=UPI002B21437C|nr:TIM-barrel domain-containing protein [Nodularia spumigena]MEA5557702.1 TIM-barrel domain-containing protein [Nodularia spumigena CH309]
MRSKMTARCTPLVLLLALAGSASAQTVAARVGDNIVRFDASSADRASALPSIALQSPLPLLGPAPGGFPIAPSFQTLGDGRRRVTINTPSGSSIYGTGFVAGPLERTGKQTTLWNTDAYGWNDGTRELYQAHPWVLVVRADGSAFGVLFDTTYRTDIHTDGPASGEIIVTSQGPSVPTYVIERSSAQDVVMTLADLTGKPFMPPLWALGYHQCRYSYTPDTRVLEVAQEFRDRQIPADVIWMDIDYMDGYRMFTFNPTTFPNPAGLDAALDAIDFRTVAIIDPHIKREPGYFVYDQGTAGNHWVLNSGGVLPYVAPVWPGDSVFVDYTRQATRDWWASLYPPFLATGIDGVWNDMNEPAVFVSSKTMPENNIHRADAALGGTGPHARYHNVYGMQMARATREGMLLARPGDRPFVLTRANFLGGQRYAATWTGDNVADWYHVDVSIQNVLNLGLSGQPHVGPDIGGFVGPGNGQQFGRWMGFGALLPFARGHTATGNIDKEPWAFGPGVERISRLAIQRRYRLLPHFYTLAHEAHETGLPIARPLFFTEPTNIALRTLDDAFMLGEGLIVSAATSEGGTPARPPLQTPLYRFGFDQSQSPTAASDFCEPELPHLYLLGGHIVPSGPIIQSTRDGYLSELTLLVALDEHGIASGTLYEDAGDGFGYQSGDYLRTTYEAVRDGQSVTVSVAATEGARARPTRPLTVRLLLADGFEVSATGVDGQPLVLEVQTPDAPFDCDAQPPVDPREIDGRFIPLAFEPSESRAT